MPGTENYLISWGYFHEVADKEHLAEAVTDIIVNSGTKDVKVTLTLNEPTWTSPRKKDL